MTSKIVSTRKFFAFFVVLLSAHLLATPAQAKRISLSGLLARIVALEGTVADLQTENTQLQADLAAEAAARQAADDALQALIDALPGGSLPALQARVAELEDHSVPRLADYVEVIDLFRDLNGDGTDDPVPTIWVEGANVQIVDGSGSTLPVAGRPSGLGNLIVGYDEDTLRFVCSNGAHLTQVDCEAAGEIWAANQKNGAHNLVVGPEHFYSESGGVVFGQQNFINGQSAVVLAGRENTASGSASSVSGGEDNTASGSVSSVSGGLLNTASGNHASVSGGAAHTASGLRASISGGERNRADGRSSSISGGFRNQVSGDNSSVSGGTNRAASGRFNWVAGSLFEPN